MSYCLENIRPQAQPNGRSRVSRYKSELVRLQSLMYDNSIKGTTLTTYGYGDGGISVLDV